MAEIVSINDNKTSFSREFGLSDEGYNEPASTQDQVFQVCQVPAAWLHLVTGYMLDDSSLVGTGNLYPSYSGWPTPSGLNFWTLAGTHEAKMSDDRYELLRQVAWEFQFLVDAQED